MSKIQLDLLVDEEQVPMLADCMHLGEVGRPTLLDWKKKHEELMTSIAKEKAKAADAAWKKATAQEKEGEEDHGMEDVIAGRDVSAEATGMIHIRMLRKSPHKSSRKGKGKGKVPPQHPEMGQLVSILTLLFYLYMLTCPYRNLAIICLQNIATSPHVGSVSDTA